MGPSRQMGLLVPALFAAALAVAGCSAGQVTQTDSQIAAVNGEQAQVGPLRVSNAVLAYPETEPAHWAAGSDIPLSMTITNNGASNDQLQSVNTALSDDIVITGDRALIARRSLVVGGSAAEKESAEEAAVDAGESGNATIVLRSITRNLYPGQVAMVELVFRDAGAVQLRVPIEAPAQPRTAEPEEAGGGH